MQVLWCYRKLVLPGLCCPWNLQDWSQAKGPLFARTSRLSFPRRITMRGDAGITGPARDLVPPRQVTQTKGAGRHAPQVRLVARGDSVYTVSTCLGSSQAPIHHHLGGVSGRSRHGFHRTAASGYEALGQTGENAHVGRLTLEGDAANIRNDTGTWTVGVSC